MATLRLALRAYKTTYPKKPSKASAKRAEVQNGTIKNKDTNYQY